MAAGIDGAASADRGVLLIKLGGSLITDKRRPRTVRDEVLERVASEIADALQAGAAPLLLGHGSGSFGHVSAHEHGVLRGIRSPADLAGVVATQAAAAELHVRVLAALRGAGVPAYSLAPSSCMIMTDGVPSDPSPEPLQLAVARGLTPVTYGDVVMDRRRGAAICSTENALLAFARALLAAGGAVRGACWFGDTDGVLDASGATLERIDPRDLETVLAVVGGSDAVDVTGGMRHRLRAAAYLAERGTPSWILDGRQSGAVRAALGGDPVGGTLVAA